MAKRHQQREQSHEELQSHIRQLKKSAFDKKNLSADINKLQRKLNQVIIHEKKIAGMHQHPEERRTQVNELKDQVAQMSQHMKAMQKKVDKHLKENKKLQESQKDLKSIIPLPEKGRKISEMKHKISHLEDLYERYKDSGARNIDRIKLKIESIKARLAVA